MFLYSLPLVLQSVLLLFHLVEGLVILVNDFLVLLNFLSNFLSNGSSS